MPRHLRWLWLAALGLALLAAPGSTTLADTPPPVQRISQDPYQDPVGQHATQVEPDTFAWGTTVVATFQTGRIFNGGASNIGWATSTDGGSSWRRGFLPSLTTASEPPGVVPRASDPAVAYDAVHGVWLISSLTVGVTFGGAPQALGVVVQRSTDGFTWSAPVPVTSGQGPDKNWIVCDNGTASPFRGRCYVSWSRSQVIVTSTSSDGGLTWGAPVAGVGSPKGVGVQPIVQPNGTLILPFLDDGDTLAALVSTNGGASFGGKRVIADVQFTPISGFRSPPLPSAEVDGVGRVFVAWSDCRFRPACAANDIVFSASTDGTAWTPPARIPTSTLSGRGSAMVPGLGVDPTTAGASARLALTSYEVVDPACQGDTCALAVVVTTSTDAGVTWSAPQALSPQPIPLAWVANTNQGRMVGDYISTSFVGGQAVAVFALAAPPHTGVFDEAMYAALVQVAAEPATPTATASPTTRPPTSTATPTASPTTRPPTSTATPTASPTTHPPTSTATPTASPTTHPPTSTATPTATPTTTPTATPTTHPPTSTPTPTATAAPPYRVFLPLVIRADAP